MKKLILSIILGIVAGLIIVQYAHADCTANYITMPDGKIMYCITCCDPYGNNCITNCS